MPQGLIGCHPGLGIPVKASGDKVDKERFVFGPFGGADAVSGRIGGAIGGCDLVALSFSFKGRGQTPVSGWSAWFTSSRRTALELDGAVRPCRGHAVARVALGAKKHFSSFGLLDEPRWRHAQQLNHAGQLVRLVFAGQERVSEMELSQDAPQRPHIDG